MSSGNLKGIRSGEAMLCFRVLGYLAKDGAWAAHCLETDLVGYGKTFNAALGKLQELTEMQVSFALFKNQPSLLDRPAPVEIIEAYTTLYRSVLQSFAIDKDVSKRHRVANLPWPTPRNRSDSCFVQA
jgi:hypothetical protein